jgi:hypothetical protein
MMTVRPTLSELKLLLIHIRDAPTRRRRVDVERLRHELMRVTGRDSVTLVDLAERQRNGLNEIERRGT